MKTTLSGEQVSLQDNCISYFDKNNRIYKSVSFLNDKEAKREYNRITNTHRGRPIGSINKHCHSHRKPVMVFYGQLIIEL